MQCILSALKSESEPFIKFYNLEKDSRFPFPVFRKKDLYLVGIGVGKKYIESRVNDFIQKMENFLFLVIMIMEIIMIGETKKIKN